MVEVQIFNTDQFLEVLDPSITYVKTAGDLGSITQINSSYSWTFKIPKTPNNTMILDGLGLIGSNSRKPYEKIYCNVLDNAFPIVIKGLLNIKNTSDNYVAFVQEGFIDFLKDINNETMGKGLDLSTLDHERNYSHIINSFSLNLPYAYLVADVNGAYFPNEDNTTHLDPLYMAPYANVGYLFNLIFQAYGWTFEANSEVRKSINDTWMSYPSEIVLDSSTAIQVGLMTSGAVNGQYYKGGVSSEFVYKIPLLNRTLDPNFITPLNVSNLDFVVNVTGEYKFTFHTKGTAQFRDDWGNITNKPYASIVVLNGSNARGIRDSGSSDGTIITLQLALNAGDIIGLGASFRPIRDGNRYDESVIVSEASLLVENISTGGEVSFTQALIKLKISDFIKEVMTREALTAFVDSDKKNIKFLTLKERVSAPAEDWTDNYIQRLNESYLYQDYARQNYMRHKYAEDLADYNDGILEIENDNLEPDKTIYPSISFSPDRNLTTFTDHGTDYKIPRLPMFDVEVSEDKDTGDLIGTYKFLEGRFFFVKAQQVNRTIFISGNDVTGFPMANMNGNIFRDIVFEKYAQFINFSEDAKVHEIEMALSLYDILGLDLSKLYYFEQEASFYILNKLTYKSGQKTKGEFLRVIPEIELRSFSNAFSNAFSI